MRGVAETRAAVCRAARFGTRTFQHGRHIGAVMGVVPVPYRSDPRVRDQGIRRAGRPALRRIARHLAWGWVRGPPTRAWTPWCLTRVGPAGGRRPRIGIVALARKLAIARWRDAEHGVVPEGAMLHVSCAEGVTDALRPVARASTGGAPLAHVSGFR
jgi:transposase